MAHLLVEQLKFARQSFLTGLTDISNEDAQKRVGQSNSISWIIGHLAEFEQTTYVITPQNKTISEAVKACGYGLPASTPPFGEMLDAWQAITAAANLYLEQLTADDLGKPRILSNGEPSHENHGTLLLRHMWHYWYHTGEVQGIRQALGHHNLPQYVGQIPPYAAFRGE